MEMIIPCSNCQSQLRVPSDAAGRNARCSHCNIKFRLPESEQLLEDTVMGWLVEDVENEDVENEDVEDKDEDEQYDVETQSSYSTAVKISPRKSIKPRLADNAADELARRWCHIPASVRDQMGKWFKFRPGEHMLRFLADSDLWKFDRGRAGIVITNRRIVYRNKYRSDSISLDANGEIMMIKDGPCYDVVYRYGRFQREVKLARLRSEAAAKLINTLDGLHMGLRVIRAVA